MAGESAVHVPYLQETLVFLVATVLVVPLVQRLKASPILGYLAVGTLVGPHALGFVQSVDGVRAFAELGVVFLLFTVGLELSVQRLRAMRRYVFGLGAAQVGLTGLVVGLVAAAWGNPAPAAAVIGACLALSSTAMVIQLLSERGAIASRSGRASFSILLFQDLAVVPILIMVTALGTRGEEPLWQLAGLAILKAVAVVGAIILIGQFLLRGVLRAVAATRTQELITATTLLVILVIAVVTGRAGLSMALGAFLAGLLLAETEFRHQVETDILPFKGLLLGLFFISVGMQLDVPLVAAQFDWILLAVAGLFLVKAVLILGLCRLFGLPLSASLRSAMALGGAGEFAFVVLGAALSGGVVEAETAQFMQIVAGLSMVLTPVLLPLGDRLARLVDRDGRPSRDDTPADLAGEDLADHVVICGYGRVGQTVAELLRSQAVPHIALDLDIRRVRASRQRGEPVFYGDASRADVLTRLGMEHAVAVVITLDHPEAARRAFETVRRQWPLVRVFMRARDAAEAEEYLALGARDVVPETLEASLQLSGRVLQALGTPIEAVNALIERIRSERYVRIARLGSEDTAPPSER